ncbi:MAG: Hsp20 family protein [Alphaproteobacteria bacterium]|nr:Hsp20 family protein [Alphaproteobacteria bacterium]
MRSFDFAPLFRSTVGFDRLASALESSLSAEDSAFSYPPYNIEKTGEDTYRITLAVAGFGESEIEIVQHEDTLSVVGEKKGQNGQAAQYLYRGIAGRAFKREFQLADHVRVTGASMDNGLLHVDLVREVPEAMKPRKIEVKRASGDKTLIEGAAKAA